MKRTILSLLCAFAFIFSGLVWAATVNINTADAEVLASQLTGVGEKRAAAIVSYRDQHGPFQSVDELAAVKGIGPVILEKNRQSIAIGSD